MPKTMADRIRELDEKILAITEKRWAMHFDNAAWTPARLKTWMDYAQAVEKLDEEKRKLIAQEQENGTVYA